MGKSAKGKTSNWDNQSRIIPERGTSSKGKKINNRKKNKW